jgi:GTP-binding protein HflX
LRGNAEAQGAVILSAARGVGVDALEERIAGVLTGTAREVSFILPLSDGRRLAWLHAHGDIISEEDAGEGQAGPLRRVTVRLNPKELGQFATLSD